jgi:pilus assembly protein Flp/PilA
MDLFRSATKSLPHSSRRKIYLTQWVRHVTFFVEICLVYSTEGGPQARRLYLERKYHMLFAPKEKGQGLVEYAIILALVAIVVIAVMRILGPKIGNTFSTINSSLPN